MVVIAGSSAGRDDHTAAVVAEVGTLAVHGVAVRPGHPVVLGVAEATPRPRRARLSRLSVAHFRHLRRPAARAAAGRATARVPSCDSAARPQARLDHGDGRLGARSTRSRGRPARGHPAPARGGRAHLAGARRRSARGAGGARGAPRGRGGVGAAAARRGRDRAHHRGHGLARPRARPRRLHPARARPAAHARVVERRLARRANRAAGWAVPCGRLAFARPGERRVHAALSRAPASRAARCRWCGSCTGSRG